MDAFVAKKLRSMDLRSCKAPRHSFGDSVPVHMAESWLLFGPEIIWMGGSIIEYAVGTSGPSVPRISLQMVGC